MRKFQKRAKLRIEKELDIVNFMKKQLKLSIAIESLLSRPYMTFVNTDKHLTLEESVSDDS